MSENNNDNNRVIITEAELVTPEPYDFDFIALSLGLIPICGSTAAINPGAITDIDIDDNGEVTFSLHGGESYTLNLQDMAELDQFLRQRIEDNKAKAKEAMKDQIKMQAEVMTELQGGVQPGGMIVGAPTSRRYRQ